MKMIILVQ